MESVEITDKHIFGWEKEEILKAKMEKVLGYEIKKTETRFDEIDFTNLSGEKLVELKSRRAYDDKGNVQAPHSFLGWVIPTAKTLKCKRGMTLDLFYYWAWSDELYHIKYDADLFDTFNEGCPPWKQSQRHIWVPAELWRKV